MLALQPMFERVLCAPASSAPVERVSSQSGLLVQMWCTIVLHTLVTEVVTVHYCNISYFLFLHDWFFGFIIGFFSNGLEIMSLALALCTWPWP